MSNNIFARLENVCIDRHDILYFAINDYLLRFSIYICWKKWILNWSKNILLSISVEHIIYLTDILTSRNLPSCSLSRKYEICKSHFPAAMLPSIFSFLESLMHKRCVALLSYFESVDTSPPRSCITCSHTVLSC